MSEPYEGGDCLFCDSSRTLVWLPDTAVELGYRRECLSCEKRWDFPSTRDLIDIDPDWKYLADDPDEP